MPAQNIELHQTMLQSVMLIFAATYLLACTARPPEGTPGEEGNQLHSDSTTPNETRPNVLFISIDDLND